MLRPQSSLLLLLLLALTLWPELAQGNFYRGSCLKVVNKQGQARYGSNIGSKLEPDEEIYVMVAVFQPLGNMRARYPYAGKYFGRPLCIRESTTSSDCREGEVIAYQAEAYRTTSWTRKPHYTEWSASQNVNVGSYSIDTAFKPQSSSYQFAKYRWKTNQGWRMDVRGWWARFSCGWRGWWWMVKRGSTAGRQSSSDWNSWVGWAMRYWWWGRWRWNTYRWSSSTSMRGRSQADRSYRFWISSETGNCWLSSWNSWRWLHPWWGSTWWHGGYWHNGWSPWWWVRWYTSWGIGARYWWSWWWRMGTHRRWRGHNPRPLWGSWWQWSHQPPGPYSPNKDRGSGWNRGPGDCNHKWQWAYTYPSGRTTYWKWHGWYYYYQWEHAVNWGTPGGGDAMAPEGPGNVGEYFCSGSTKRGQWGLSWGNTNKHTWDHTGGSWTWSHMGAGCKRMDWLGGTSSNPLQYQDQYADSSWGHGGGWGRRLHRARAMREQAAVKHWTDETERRRLMTPEEQAAERQIQDQRMQHEQQGMAGPYAPASELEQDPMREPRHDGGERRRLVESGPFNNNGPPRDLRQLQAELTQAHEFGPGAAKTHARLAEHRANGGDSSTFMLNGAGTHNERAPGMMHDPRVRRALFDPQLRVRLRRYLESKHPEPGEVDDVADDEPAPGYFDPDTYHISVGKGLAGPGLAPLLRVMTTEQLANLGASNAVSPFAIHPEVDPNILGGKDHPRRKDSTHDPLLKRADYLPGGKSYDAGIASMESYRGLAPVTVQAARSLGPSQHSSAGRGLAEKEEDTFGGGRLTRIGSEQVGVKHRNSEHMKRLLKKAAFLRTKEYTQKEIDRGQQYTDMVFEGWLNSKFGPADEQAEQDFDNEDISEHGLYGSPGYRASVKQQYDDQQRERRELSAATEVTAADDDGELYDYDGTGDGTGDNKAPAVLNPWARPLTPHQRANNRRLCGPWIYLNTWWGCSSHTWGTGTGGPGRWWLGWDYHLGWWWWGRWWTWRYRSWYPVRKWAKQMCCMSYRSGYYTVPFWFPVNDWDWGHQTLLIREGAKTFHHSGGADGGNRLLPNCDAFDHFRAEDGTYYTTGDQVLSHDANAGYKDCGARTHSSSTKTVRMDAKSKANEDMNDLSENNNNWWGRNWEYSTMHDDACYWHRSSDWWFRTTPDDDVYVPDHTPGQRSGGGTAWKVSQQAERHQRHSCWSWSPRSTWNYKDSHVSMPRCTSAAKCPLAFVLYLFVHTVYAFCSSCLAARHTLYAHQPSPFPFDTLSTKAAFSATKHGDKTVGRSGEQIRAVSTKPTPNTSVDQPEDQT